MDNELGLRETALKAIRETKWVPSKGEARITAMIENRPDWCISRQRAWGVPIALFLHRETGEMLRDEKSSTASRKILKRRLRRVVVQKPAGLSRNRL